MIAMLLSMLAIALTHASEVRTAAQAPSVAAPTISGTWALDPYLSDKPEQVARELRFDTGDVEEELRGREAERGEGGGFGRSGAGRGGFGRSGPARAQSRNQLSDDDRKKLKELTDAVQFAPATLTIAQTDGDVVFASSKGTKQTVRANGKAEKYQLDAGIVDLTASWEGQQLVVAYEVGHAGILRYTYLLVPTTKQLLVRVNFERRPVQPGPFDVKLVYNRAPAH